MKIPPLHSWDVTPPEAIALQKQLRGKLVIRGGPESPRWIAGGDAALMGDEIVAVAILWDLQERRLVEHHVVRAPLTFPYVPGLLTFREGPALLQAFAKLEKIPDLVLFDGQGIAHPRRLGIAAHMGLCLDLPTIGVAKSRLVGEFSPLGEMRGSSSPLFHQGEQIGFVYRSREGCNPLFISPGHKVGLEKTLPLVEPCFERYRLPEPTRIADKLSKDPSARLALLGKDRSATLFPFPRGR